MKILLLGSAPYMIDWVKENLVWFINNNYKIVAFNNSFKLIDEKIIYHRHCSTDFQKCNTYIPNKYILEDPKKTIMQFKGEKRRLYRGKSTMLFSVLHHYITEHIKSIINIDHIVVIGCDLIYSKQGDTFYSDKGYSKARNDPTLMYTDRQLKKELDNIKNICDSIKGCDIFNASTFETRLPFDRFIDYLKQ